MSPETPEGRERLTRLEERVDANKRQIEVFGPLPLQMGLVQRGQEELRDDMGELRRDIDRRFEKAEVERKEWQKEFTRAIKNDLVHCSNEIAKVAESFKADRAAEREEKTQSKTSTRAMWGLLGAAAVSGMFALLIQVVQSFGG